MLSISVLVVVYAYQEVVCPLSTHDLPYPGATVQPSYGRGRSLTTPTPGEKVRRGIGARQKKDGRGRDFTQTKDGIYPYGLNSAHTKGEQGNMQCHHSMSARPSPV